MNKKSIIIGSLVILLVGFGLMYLNVITVIRAIHKAGVVGGIITIAVPLITYLTFLALSSDIPIGYIAIIPTTSICLSLFVSDVFPLGYICITFTCLSFIDSIDK